MLQQISQVLIPLERVAPGMFPSERAVTVRAHDGPAVSLFADEQLLEQHGERQMLRVTRIQLDSARGISVCLLPTEPEDGSRWIRVLTTTVVLTI